MFPILFMFHGPVTIAIIASGRRQCSLLHGTDPMPWDFSSSPFFGLNYQAVTATRFVVAKGVATLGNNYPYGAIEPLIFG
jgi:hypothetical protein